MNKILKISSLLVFSVVIAGCAAKHNCQLGEECYGLEDAYQAALENGGNSETVLPEYSNKGKGKKIASSSANAENLQLQGFSAYAGEKLTNKPIYQPPKPIRIWIAPWQAELDSDTQKDPVLMGDQFLYATIPGYWQMGELRSEGEAAQMLLEPSFNNNSNQAKQTQRVQPQQQLIEANK